MASLWATRAKLKNAKAAIRAFTEAYPDTWSNILHEEGCVGVQLSPKERSEGEICECDGDYLTTVVRKGLR